jgi:hypothetical protein
VTDAEPQPQPQPQPLPHTTPPSTAGRPGKGVLGAPLGLVAIVLAGADAVLLLGGVLYAFASADANGADASDRFRLLGQAANPFIAFLALVVSVIVVHQRQRQHQGPGNDHLGGRPQVASAAALGIATAVSLAVVLLALNGVLTDVTGSATALFKLSAVVSRLAAIGMAGFALWLGITAAPPRQR